MEKIAPFKSKAQVRACYAKDDPDWNCKKWSKHTPNKKSLPEHTKTAEFYFYHMIKGFEKVAEGLPNSGVRKTTSLLIEEIGKLPGGVEAFIQRSKKAQSSARAGMMSKTAQAPNKWMQAQFTQAKIDSVYGTGADLADRSEAKGGILPWTIKHVGGKIEPAYKNPRISLGQAAIQQYAWEMARKSPQYDQLPPEEQQRIQTEIQEYTGSRDIIDRASKPKSFWKKQKESINKGFIKKEDAIKETGIRDIKDLGKKVLFERGARKESLGWLHKKYPSTWVTETEIKKRAPEYTIVGSPPDQAAPPAVSAGPKPGAPVADPVAAAPASTPAQAPAPKAVAPKAPPIVKKPDIGSGK